MGIKICGLQKQSDSIIEPHPAWKRHPPIAG